jgi:uncharacterized protein YwqG
LSDRASIELTLTEGPPPVSWASKVGGLPYLVQAAEHPLEPFGNPLVFIAQLNFGELPDLLDFPTDGLMGDRGFSARQQAPHFAAPLLVKRQ